MITGSIDLIAGTSFIIGQDIWATVDEQLHDGTDIIGPEMRDLVKQLTPVLSGSLQMDISYEAYPDVGNEDLVYIYAEDTAQEAYWNRIYVQYQEGGQLGEETYTNPPREMFMKVAEGDGIDVVASWALDMVERAILLCESGAGIPF